MSDWIDQHSGQLLRSGDTTLYVFDWAALSAEEKSIFVECYLYALHEKITAEGKKTGELLANEMIPFAILGPEEGLEPEEVAEFDAQCDGVLLRQDGRVLCCAESTSADLEPYADSIDELAVEKRPSGRGTAAG